jgi:hypothetical protein
VLVKIDGDEFLAWVQIEPRKSMGRASTRFGRPGALARHDRHGRAASSKA